MPTKTPPTHNAGRRKFLKGSLFAGASTFCALPANAEPKGANDDLRIGVIGAGGRGGGHVKALLGQKGVRVVALCDADYERNESNAKRVADKQGQLPKVYEDYRKMVEDKEIDGVMIATPNHGAVTADLVRSLFAYRLVFGPSGQQLATGINAFARDLPVPDCEFGVIAGAKGDEVGFNPLLGEDNDGVVARAVIDRAAEYSVVERDAIRIEGCNLLGLCVRYLMESGRAAPGILKKKKGGKK